MFLPVLRRNNAHIKGFKECKCYQILNTMKHIIDGKEVDIDWEVGETYDNHGSGCKDVQLEGIGDDGNKYWASGNTQDGELVEVYDEINLAD
jgi:hypothetical protein